MTPEAMTPDQIAERLLEATCWDAHELGKGFLTGVGALIKQAIAAAIQAERAPLENLLCRIHRDGGHYLHAHGLEKACQDADEIVAKLNVEHDARSEYIPSIKELTPQPWGITVQMLPGGAFLLNPTENEERVRVAYLKAMEAEVEAARKVIEPLEKMAQYVENLCPNIPDDASASGLPPRLTVGHCRAAKEWVDAHAGGGAPTAPAPLDNALAARAYSPPPDPSPEGQP